jgi:hypothetical protein
MGVGHFYYDMQRRGMAGGYDPVIHAAYISGEKVHDEVEDKTRAWGSKERVVHSEISVPKNAPAWAREVASEKDAARLWNMAKKAELTASGELRKNATFYRSVVLTLDNGLFIRDQDGQINAEATRQFQAVIVREHVQEAFLKRGMIAHWAIHWDPKNPQQNPHAHIMLPMRAAVDNGFSRYKDGKIDKVDRRHWQDNQVVLQRAHWAGVQNERLRALGLPYRIDHRSYQDRGISLESQHKHYNRDERKEELEKLLRKQSAKLAQTPAPFIALVEQSFIAPFSRDDLHQLARRVAPGDHQCHHLLKAVYNSGRLERMEDGRYWVLPVQPRHYQGDPSQSPAGDLDKISSWEKFDRQLMQSGWRMETVPHYDEKKKKNIFVFELVSLSDPSQRHSARDCHPDFTPGQLRSFFGESRIRYELKTIASEGWKEFYQKSGYVKEGLKVSQKQENRSFVAMYHRAMEKHLSWKRSGTQRFSIPKQVAYHVNDFIWERRRKRLEAAQEQARLDAAARIARLKTDQKRAVTLETERHQRRLFRPEEHKTAQKLQRHRQQVQALKQTDQAGLDQVAEAGRIEQERKRQTTLDIQAAAGQALQPEEQQRWKALQGRRQPILPAQIAEPYQPNQPRSRPASSSGDKIADTLKEYLFTKNEFSRSVLEGISNPKMGSRLNELVDKLVKHKDWNILQGAQPGIAESIYNNYQRRHPQQQAQDMSRTRHRARDD